MFGKLFDGGFGRFETFAAFELERFGNDADGQNTFGFGQLGNDRRGTRTGTAAHAGGKKDHIGESLRVGIGNDKVNAFQILRNHIIDGIAAAAADTDDGNPRFQVHNSFFRYG